MSICTVHVVTERHTGESYQQVMLHTGEVPCPMEVTDQSTCGLTGVNFVSESVRLKQTVRCRRELQVLRKLILLTVQFILLTLCCHSCFHCAGYVASK